MEENYRKLCQVFTPKENVRQLLDWCGYNSNLWGKKIIENSCGDGQIIQEIVRRYIKDGLKNGLSKDAIEKGLNNDIYGIEYDIKQYKKCLQNLNEITEEYGLSNVEWVNIEKCDALKKKHENKFDFVVGNPPYIKYKSLSIRDREYIKKEFETCKKGKFDYCYAFIETSIRALKRDGKMAYLIPSSIFKNVFAEELREYIKPHIIKVYDFTTIKLFNKDTNNQKKERLTSSAIMILKKDSNRRKMKYIDITKDKSINIDKKKLTGKWIFTNEETNMKNKLKFGEYFNASNTIATLCNKVYVVKEYTEDANFIYPKTGGKIEKEIIRDTISPKTFESEKTEKIIFPYYYQNNQLIRYTEKEFEEKFYYACQYLKTFEEELNNRNSDQNARWFEYGRSQALKKSNAKKLILSTVITNEVKTKIVSKNNIPYSGIYIIPIRDKTLKTVEEILKSSAFFQYISTKGINASGNSLRITARDINEYWFN